MAKEKKIILFLSTPKRNESEQTYVCPDKSEVRGVRTNDAPIKYLLGKYPNVTEILCLVTNAAKKTAWDDFNKVVEATGSKAKCVEIEFEEGTRLQEILPNILGCIGDGDELLLDVTGGFRNTMMYLMLISRALSYKGVKTACAVYSNFQQGREKQKVEDVTEILQVFDLIDGMQNLTSFGNVRALRSYYEGRPHDDKITALLDAVDKLWQSITLCRSNLVPGQITAFNQALRDAKECSDPLLQALLPAFRNKFGEEMTIPSLIQWCAESDMIQQALTLYRERIPAYIMNERTDILAVKPKIPPINMKNYPNYDTQGEARFYTQFLNIGHGWYAGAYGKDAYKAAKEKEGDYLITLKNFEKALPQSIFEARCSVEQLRTITMDYLYIRALRNMVNHASDEAQKNQQALNKYLAEEGHYKIPDETNAEDVKYAILTGLKHLNFQQ
ncbi:MAG: TM1812 family CRISPR-associated protein [Clostridiales bacterium]|nr:TM1812 family CRISPR-associated protein [Clostridiales bacterium]